MPNTPFGTGIRTFHDLSGLDDRIQTAASSCYIASWKRMLESIGPQDAEQVFPLWLKDGLEPDYLYAFGDKPYLLLTAIRDFFPIGGARATFEEAQKVCRLGFADRITMFEADDGHGYGYGKPRRETAFRWFSRWLQPTENTEPEAPLSLATVEELQRTRTGQVQTEFPGSADVFTMNRKVAQELRANRKPSSGSVRKYARELSYYDAATGRFASRASETPPGLRAKLKSSFTRANPASRSRPCFSSQMATGVEARPSYLQVAGQIVSGSGSGATGSHKDTWPSFRIWSASANTACA